MALNLNNDKGELVRDPYNNKERHDAWKASKKLVVHDQGSRLEITGTNRDVILHYLDDLEYGVNALPSGKKGARSHTHLNNSRQRIGQLAHMFETRTGKSLPLLGSRDVVTFFHDMRGGTLRTNAGQKYRCTRDYAKVFKAFWHWHMRAQSSGSTSAIRVLPPEYTTQPRSRAVHSSSDSMDFTSQLSISPLVA